MREIHGVREAVRRLEPHWPEIEEWFAAQNARFLKIVHSDHDALGRVLKAHLAIESFLDDFLANRLGKSEMERANLRFFQKACLLPETGHASSFVRPGVLRLNSIRNDFAHDPEAEISDAKMNVIYEVLEIARRGTRFDSHVEAIEAFAAVASAFLIVSPPGIDEAFADAFAQIRVELEPDV